MRDGADYVGIGAVWETGTKRMVGACAVVGVRAVGGMLGELDGTGVKAVAIGSFSVFLSLSLA